MPTITLSKKQIQKSGGVVVLSIAEYKKLSERAACLPANGRRQVPDISLLVGRQETLISL